MLIIVVGNAGRITAASPRGRPRELQCRKLLRSHPTRAPRSLMPWASAAAAQAARKANDVTQRAANGAAWNLERTRCSICAAHKLRSWLLVSRVSLLTLLFG